MKKRLLLFLLVILIPSVFATINFDSFESDEYNYGDEIQPQGYVFVEDAISGFFKLALDCDGTTFNLPITLLSLESGEKKNFPAELSIPKITISRSLEGSCVIKATLVSNNEVVDSETSDIFYITQELKGDFTIDETRIQAGKSFNLEGDITNLNDVSTDGSAEIYFEDEERFLVDIASIKNGKLDYTYESTSIPAGTYDIDVLVNDVYGNQHLFSDVAEFTLITELYIFAETDKKVVDPGEKIKVSGDVRTILQESVDSATVQITLGDQKYVTKLKGSKYDYDLSVPEDIKSGTQKILVEVSDGQGNKGSTETFVDISVVPTDLELEFDQSSYQPGDVIGATAMLYDQGGDLIRDFVDVTFYDPSGDLLLEDSSRVNEKQQYSLDLFAVPGMYSYKAVYKELDIKGTIQVETVSKIDVELNNQTLVISNTGNVNYKESIVLVFNNGEYEISEKLSLRPGAVREIDLADMVPSGSYSLVITYDGSDEEYGLVNVVGKGKRSFNLIYAILVVIFVGLLGYVAYSKKRKNRSVRLHIHKERKKGKEQGEKLRAEKKHRRPLQSKFGVATKEDTEEFKRRVLRDIQRMGKKKED